MKWISVEERLPETYQTCLVLNNKGWMSDGTTRALYNPDYKVFTLYDLNYRDSLTLEVTHWLPIPNPPELQK